MSEHDGDEHAGEANVPAPPSPHAAEDPAAPEPEAEAEIARQAGGASAPSEPVPQEPAPAAELPHPAPAPLAEPPAVAQRASMLEPPEPVLEVPRARLAAQSRRDFILFSIGLLAAASGAWVLLPDRARRRLLPGPAHDALDTIAARAGLTPARREGALSRVLTFDDDVAEALYSRNRLVRTYERSQVTPLRNNYAGRTPGPGILEGWKLNLSGLAAGGMVQLTHDQLIARFPLHGQVTRLVCVEGWSAIAWWGGIRFADLLAAFPPAPGARWAGIRSEVNLDGHGRSDPYYVSLDLETLRHPQALLATHQAGRPLSLAHGAPLRLLVPMKLGLKNIKAITHIAYSDQEPIDYWNKRGYSKYDGI